MIAELQLKFDRSGIDAALTRLESSALALDVKIGALHDDHPAHSVMIALGDLVGSLFEARLVGFSAESGAGLTINIGPNDALGHLLALVDALVAAEIVDLPSPPDLTDLIHGDDVGGQA